MFIKSDFYGNFFIVCSYEFDNQLSIIYSESNRSQFEIQIERTVQPGGVQCFDMSVMFSEQKGECEVRLLSATDNGFTFDKAKFQYIQSLIETDSFKKKIIIKK